ncbi:SDR family oxidoreductase [Nocardia sp. NPDC050435]|uniref:SDR family oxidoreductase n=1 Tax=Nocardia sp. NPDC050435 TaxID=3155040 RepID=UPI0033DF9E0D
MIVNYREKRKRAEAIAADIVARGGSASVVGADLADPESVRGLADGIAAEFGRLDVVVLNASGGLERGAAPGYAMALNRDAQVRLVRVVLPLLPVNGRIVFVTSHQAHFFGRKPVPEEYVPIAASKRAGEDALRAMIPELGARGVGLRVVSGDMIEGTIIVRLLGRRDPGAVAARKGFGELPSVAEFARAVADAATEAGESGRTVYVGGADYLDAARLLPGDAGV